MANSKTSPYASSFNAAIKRGTSFNTAVQNIAARSNKKPEVVWNSLFRAGICGRQKFNGQWIYFPWNAKKSNATVSKNSQVNSWQWFVEWSIQSGFCTPEQLWNNCGSQKEFMTYCRKFFGKQFDSTSTPSKSRSKSTRGNKTRSKSSYKISSSKSRSTSSRRYRRAA